MLLPVSRMMNRSIFDRALCALDSPFKIQKFLDTLSYSTENRYRSPVSVWRDRSAHCYDGAIFGAAALRMLGFRPMIMELGAVRDDEHLVALFRINGHWGAVAKSNCVGLRLREAIHRGFRELAVSYFDDYFNTLGEKTLRYYRRPLSLEPFDRYDWVGSDETIQRIADRIDDLPKRALLTPGMVSRLAPVDALSYQAGLLNANPAGLYRPARKERKSG